VKVSFISFIIMIFTFGASGCSGDDSIKGKYKSIIFIQPSASDYAVNLHEEGGYAEFIFKDDSTFTAKFYVPELSHHQLPQNESVYEGKYSVSGDTIKLSGTNTFLNTEKFVYKDGQISLINRLRRGPFNIVLKKEEE